MQFRPKSWTNGFYPWKGEHMHNSWRVVVKQSAAACGKTLGWCTVATALTLCITLLLIFNPPQLGASVLSLAIVVAAILGLEQPEIFFPAWCRPAGLSAD